MVRDGRSGDGKKKKRKRNDDKRPILREGEGKRDKNQAGRFNDNAGASILKRHFDQRRSSCRSVKSVKCWTRINSITKNGSHLEEKDFLDHRRRMPPVSKEARCYGDFFFPRGSHERGVIAWKAGIFIVAGSR